MRAESGVGFKEDFHLAYATANGIQLYYESHGKGAPLLLIGGLGYGGWVWRKQAPAFASHFQVITFDNRGVGQSDKPDLPYTVPMLAADALGLLDALRVEKAHVLGASLGGMIALQLALDRPARVDRLILCATTFGGANVVLPKPEVLQFMAQRAGTAEERFARGMELAFSKPFLASRAPEADFIRQEMAKNRQPDAAYLRQAYAPLGFDVESRLDQIPRPALVIAGDQDQAVPAENAKRLAQKLPHATLALLEGAGHLCFIEQAEGFNQAVLGFLKGNA